MKKIVTCLSIIAAVFLLGSTKVNAGAIEEYLKEKPLDVRSGCEKRNRLRNWENDTLNVNVGFEGGCGDNNPGFDYYFSTQNLLINNAENIKIVSSNENMITATAKPYDFAEEIKRYEDYISWFDSLTLEEVNELVYEDYTEKPTWWEFSDYKSEPKTWWEAYNLSEEPKNTVEIVTYAKDLGEATLTLNANNQTNAITISWKIYADSFFEEHANMLAEIINNYDKYKNYVGNGDNYNIDFLILGYDKDADLSNMINALKGKDLTIRFGQDTSIGYVTFYLNGKDIKNEVGKGFTYAHDISMETSINKDKIDKLVTLTDPIYIDFTYHGQLPAPYNIDLNLKDYIWSVYLRKFEKESCEHLIGKDEYYDCRYNVYEEQHENIDKLVEEYLNSKTFTLLYYNSDTNQMEVVKENLKASDGNLKLTFDHFSSYVIVPSDGYQKKNNNAQTGTLNVVLYSGLAVISLLGIGYLIVSKKKNL